MQFHTFDPVHKIPLTEMERNQFKKHGPFIAYGLTYILKQQLPEMLHSDLFTIHEIDGYPYYVFPEIRVVESTRRNTKGYAYNPVQFCLKHHQIGSVHVLHFLYALLDGPTPYIREVFMNPSTEEGFMNVLATSPYVMFNIYLNGEYTETRLADNLIREDMKEKIVAVKNIPNQDFNLFMPAKGEIQDRFPLEYRLYEWSDPVRTIGINFVEK